MFCPRCSQEQISDQTRYCSRCGFQLGLISEILANGGTLPQLVDLYKNRKILTRRNGLIFSLFWFMLFVLILTPIFGIFDVDELAGICALLGTMGGLILMISSFLFLEKAPKYLPVDLENLPAAANSELVGASRNFLPPRQTEPAQNYVAPADSWSSPETGEIVRQPSVTEETTKLLKKRDQL